MVPGTAAAGSRRSVTAAATAAGASGPAEQQQPNFSGLWVKVPERSDRGRQASAKPLAQQCSSSAA